MMQKEEQIITRYLKSLCDNNNWQELVLEIEIQPGMLGFSGFEINNDGGKKSLRTKPTDNLKQAVKDLHRETAINEYSKWNKMVFKLKSDLSYIRDFIWDQEWQQKVNHYNLEHKKKNPDYKLPKWPWVKQELT